MEHTMSTIGAFAPCELTDLGRQAFPHCSRDLQKPNDCVFPSLVQTACPENLDLQDKRSFMGIGFGSRGTPVDLLVMLFAGEQSRENTVLIIDEFSKLNGYSREESDDLSMKGLKTLRAIREAYRLNFEVELCSSFMSSAEYAGIHRSVESRLQTPAAQAAIQESVPDSRREEDRFGTYAIHQLAACEYLQQKRGMQVKMGPSREVLYDRIGAEIGIPLQYAYVVDAFPVATPAGEEPPAVVHYVPGHTVYPTAQRIYLEDSEARIIQKLQMASEKALHYFLRLSDAAAFHLHAPERPYGNSPLPSGKRLKRMAVEQMLECVVRPLKELSLRQGES